MEISTTFIYIYVGLNDSENDTIKVTIVIDWLCEYI